MRALVEAGAQMECRSNSDISPLIACIMKNRVPIADYLLSKGAAIDFKVKMSAMKEMLADMGTELKIVFGNHISKWP